MMIQAALAPQEFLDTQRGVSYTPCQKKGSSCQLINPAIRQSGLLRGMRQQAPVLSYAAAGAGREKTRAPKTGGGLPAPCRQICPCEIFGNDKEKIQPVICGADDVGSGQ
jgi:hypothetical protein